jgi:hypothetical protein
MAGVNLFCFPVLFGLCLIWPIQVYFGSLNYFPLFVACEADSPCQGIGLARPNSRARPAHARNQSYCAKHGSGHRASGLMAICTKDNRRHSNLELDLIKKKKVRYLKHTMSLCGIEISLQNTSVTFAVMLCSHLTDR